MGAQSPPGLQVCLPRRDFGFTLSKTRAPAGIILWEGAMGSSSFIDTWQQVLYVVGTLLRPIGGLVLGVAIGWITSLTFMDPDKEWQLKIAVFLGVLGAFVTLNIYSGAGTVALFAFGVGVSIIVLGVRSMQPKKKEK
jgi:hypothetical protein